VLIRGRPVFCGRTGWRAAWRGDCCAPTDTTACEMKSRFQWARPNGRGDPGADAWGGRFWLDAHVTGRWDFGHERQGYFSGVWDLAFPEILGELFCGFRGEFEGAVACLFHAFVGGKMGGMGRMGRMGPMRPILCARRRGAGVAVLVAYSWGCMVNCTKCSKRGRMVRRAPRILEGWLVRGGLPE
jgi:hypothetical protein